MGCKLVETSHDFWIALIFLIIRYNIDQIGTKLTSRTGVDLWRIEVTFDRARGQPPLGSAQVHPMADEREDWEAYQRYKIEMRNVELAADPPRDAATTIGPLAQAW